MMLGKTRPFYSVSFLNFLIFLMLLYPTLVMAKNCQGTYKNSLPKISIIVEYDEATGILKGREIIRGNEAIDVKINGRIIHLKKKECNEGYEHKIEKQIGFIRKNVALIGSWYAVPTTLAIYELQVTVPSGLEVVSEADDVEVVKNQSGKNTFFFKFPHPREDVTLIIGKYVVFSKDFDGIKINTYFFEEHKGLSVSYIDRAIDYIRDFEHRFGPFPFKRFSIVENEFPTGFSMATMTLVGQQLLEYPFMVEQALGHEVAHSWFGNSLYVDIREGNWCEGLTTYVADYYFSEKKGEDRDYRHDTLIDYQSYVHDDNAISLSDFKFRSDRATKAVGYGKGAMVFHMLRLKLGDQIFWSGLKKFIKEYSFIKAGWKDIERVFEEVSKEDLSQFFHQWITRNDIPSLGIERQTLTKEKTGRYKVSFDIVQYQAHPYLLDIPILIETPTVVLDRTVRTSSSRRHVTIEIDSEDIPTKIIIDPGFDLFRTLSAPEFPPTVSRLLGEGKKYVYSNEKLKLDGFHTLGPGEVTREILTESSILFIGDPPKDILALSPDFSVLSSGSFIKIFQNPLNPEKVIGFLRFENKQDVQAIIKKIPHYGRYSYIEIKDGVVVKKEKARGDRGIKADLKAPILGIASSDLSDLSTIIDRIKTADVVFVGEEHDQFAHHLAQLDIIRGLVERGFKVAVGMEMFQRPFQEVLDKFIRGTITEKEFLRQSEYFTRWGYDYVLYRPILRFCREKKIPVIALNLKKEISRKVARSGIDSLSEEEKSLIPKSLDFSNEAYKKRLKVIFDAHEENQLANFECFCQAQILWDETMAESVVKYLEEHPGTKMVVLAGIGHIGFGYGIPSRVTRRADVKTAIIAATGDISDPTMADYFIFPPFAPKPFSARLGVILDVTPGKPITIKKVMPNSAAFKAGLKKGDQLLEFDGEPISSIEDLKIALLFKGPKETCTLTIKRPRRFLKDIKKTITVGPFGNEMMFHGHGSFKKR